MKLNFRILILQLLTPILFLSSCKDKRSQENKSVQKKDTLNAFILHKDSVSKTLILPSEIFPWERAELYAKIEGYIKEIKVDIGEKVKQGQVLVVLEASEHNADLLQSIANAGSAKSKFLSSQDYYNRLLIAAKEPGAISESELIKAKNQMLSDSAAYQAAQSAFRAYSQINNYLIIKAPFNGIITQRNVDPGDLVSKNTSKPLVIVENNQTLRLKVPVPEIYTDAVPESSEILFTTEASPDKKFSGKLYRKSNTVDLSNRTELWEILVDNKNYQLRSGMYANSILSVKRNNQSFTVPYSAVVTNLEKKFIIKIVKGKVVWVDVRPGINMDDRIEIFGELKEGDTLLSKATDELKPGTEIFIKLR